MKLSEIRPFVYLATLVIPFLSQCNVNCISASGKEVSEMRKPGTFSKVDVGGAMKVFLKQGTESSVSIEAAENIMPLIKTEVKGETLEISQKNSFCNPGTINVYITSPHFTGVSASGAVQVANADTLKSGDFSIDLSGASKVELAINTGSLKTDVSGACKMTLKGQCGNHKVDMSGACELNAIDLVAAKYDIDASGACKLHINVLEELNSSMSGASYIEYKGQPKTVNADNSGASKVTKIEDGRP